MRLKCACYTSLLALAFTFLYICHTAVYFAYLLWSMILECFKHIKGILKKMTGGGPVDRHLVDQESIMEMTTLMLHHRLLQMLVHLSLLQMPVHLSLLQMPALVL